MPLPYKPHRPTPRFSGNLAPLPGPVPYEPNHNLNIYIVDPYTNIFNSKAYLYCGPIAMQTYPPMAISHRIEFYTSNYHICYIYPDPTYCLYLPYELLLITGALPSELL